MLCNLDIAHQMIAVSRCWPRDGSGLVGQTGWSVSGADLCGPQACFWGQGKQDPINTIEITRLGVDVDRWFLSRFDNVQEQAKTYKQHIGHSSTMHIGVVGTVAVVEDFVPSAADLDDQLACIQQGLRRDLTMEKLLQMIDFEHLD